MAHGPLVEHLFTIIDLFGNQKDTVIFFLNIHYLFCQQIDSEAVFEMSNEDLVKYVKKKLGDRCAIRRFCAMNNSQSMK